MIETNPYRLEEAEWTPRNIYDIVPPDALSYTGFEYSEGSDNVDTEKAHNSLLSGVSSFFGNLLGGIGKVLGGAVEFGVGILGGIVEGVTNLIGGFARAVGSIFGGGRNTNIEPPEPIFNPIKTNLEGAIQPHLDDIEEAKGKIEVAQQEQEQIKEDIATHGRDLSTALSKADKGIADAKAAQDSADKAISDIATKSGELSAEIEAQRKASIAREDALKNEINPKIEAAQSKGNSAMSEAQKAIENAEFVAGFADDLIPKNDSGRSTWKEGLADYGQSPEGSPYEAERSAVVDSSFTIPDSFVPVKGQEAYRLTVWAYCDPDSEDGELSFHILDSDGNPSWESSRYNFGEWVPQSDRSSVLTTTNPGSWEKHTLDFRWPDSLGPASVRIQVNPGNKFYLHDLQVRVIHPVDSAVDLAQNEVLRAHSEILRQQQEINALNTAFQEEQRIINATKNELDTLQNEAIKANSKVGETNTTAVEALKAAVDSVEQLIGLDNAYKTQQEEIDRQQNERQELLEEIQKLQGQMIPRTILYENSGNVYDDYIEISSGTVKAKGTWVGEMIVTRNYSYTGKGEDKTLWDTVQKRYSIPHLGSRNITGLNTGASTRVDYWIYPGRSERANLTGHSGYVTGEKYTGSTWGFLGSFTMPENTGKSTLRWETRLLNADRGVTYHLRLLINGTPERTSKWSGKGPMFPWGSGVDYLRPVWELNIPTGATVTIEGAITGSNISSTKAEASHNKGTLTWLEMPKGDE